MDSPLNALSFVLFFFCYFLVPVVGRADPQNDPIKTMPLTPSSKTIVRVSEFTYGPASHREDAHGRGLSFDIQLICSECLVLVRRPCLSCQKCSKCGDVIRNRTNRSLQCRHCQESNRKRKRDGAPMTPSISEAKRIKTDDARSVGSEVCPQMQSPIFSTLHLFVRTHNSNMQHISMPLER